MTIAARALDLELDLLNATDLYRWLDQRREGVDSGDVSLMLFSPQDSAAAALIAAGGTVHFPSVVVYRDGRILGDAILGYKKAAAYRHIFARRLADGDGRRGNSSIAEPSRLDLLTESGEAVEESRSWQDFSIDGSVGAYFRWVPETTTITVEIEEKIYLFDLVTGDLAQGPGIVDFIPSPDGSLFVTPGRDGSGLEFYDARTVGRAVARGEGADVQPVFRDERMRDQYPSVGLLSVDVTEDARIVSYRVLTSWFDKAAFRDYRVTIPSSGREEIAVRPSGPVVPVCTDHQVSLPILSKDGRELGGRDESTGSTKLFALNDNGRCDELLDLGIPTGKIAFDDQGDLLAFAIPAGAITEGPELHGVFLLDRSKLLLSRVLGSEGANRLTFPEFVGDKGIVFLLAAEQGGGSSRLRFVPM